MARDPEIELYVEDIFQEILEEGRKAKRPKVEDDGAAAWNDWGDDWAGQWYDNSPGGPGWTRDWYNDWADGNWRSDWQVDWNHDYNTAGPGGSGAARPFPDKSFLAGLVSRQEPFGALIYDPRSKKAFKTNSDGRGLFLLLQQRATYPMLEAEGYTRAQVDGFCDFLRGHAVMIDYLERADG